MKKILIVHTFGLGDMIMFTPALRVIKMRYPDTKIDFLIFQDFSSEPIRYNKFISNIFYADFSLRSICNTILNLRKMDYDVAFITSGVKYYKSFLFLLSLKANQKILEYTKFHLPFFTNIKREQDTHFVINNLNIISPFLNKPIDFDKIPKINFWLEEDIKLNKQDIIAIHPGCNKNFKHRRWDIQNYIKLIDLILQNLPKYKILVFIGPDEIEEGNILQNKFNNRIGFIQNSSLKEVAKNLSNCKVLINNDSGLGHISACFDTFVLTIKSFSSNANLNNTAVYTDKKIILDFTSKLSDEVEKVYITLEKIL